MEGTERKPQSGVDIRLLRPGQSWAEGRQLIETTPNSGYYEIGIEAEADCGFYEIWDNIGNAQGQFCGKTCNIGKLDARGLQNNCIYGNHILDGVVTGSKIANEAVGTEHMQNGLLSLTKLQYELQDQDKEYKEIPHVILTNLCDAFLYIADVKLDGNRVTILIGISQVYTASDPFYKLLALAK